MALNRKLVFVALITLLALAWPAAAGAIGVAGFDLYRPKSSSPDSAFHFNLDPGQEAKDVVAIKNTSDSPQTLRIYVADGVPVRNGGISLKAFDDKREGLAKWIALKSPTEITIGPGKERVIPFVLRVPYYSNSNEHIAGIVVEQTKTLTGRADDQFIINVLPRAAILITQRLPGPAIERLKITSLEKEVLAGGDLRMHMVVKNQGNIHMQPKARFRISSFGRTVKTYKMSRMPTIFPGSIGRAGFVWKNPPLIGYFTAKADIAYGRGKTDSRTITFFLMPWWLLPAIIGTTFLITLRSIIKRRRAARAAVSAPTDAEVSEAINSLENAFAEAASETDPETASPTEAPVAAGASPPRDAGPVDGRTVKKPVAPKTGGTAKPSETKRKAAAEKPAATAPKAGTAKKGVTAKKRVAKPSTTGKATGETGKTTAKKPARKPKTVKKPESPDA